MVTHCTLTRKVNAILIWPSTPGLNPSDRFSYQHAGCFSGVLYPLEGPSWVGFLEVLVCAGPLATHFLLRMSSIDPPPLVSYLDSCLFPGFRDQGLSSLVMEDIY